MNFLQNLPFKPKHKVANVIDGKLILSFPNARTPVLWQMELSNIKISALEIQTHDNQPTLVLKNPKGEIITIASFTNQNDAVNHLIAISKELGRSGGRIKSADSDTVSSVKKGGLFKKIVIGFVGLLLLFFLIGALGSPKTESVTTAAPANSSGQPMSADDFLKGY